MSLIFSGPYEDYVKVVGEPRVGPCEIVLGTMTVWICKFHGFGWNQPSPYDKNRPGHRADDRCPVSRLEEYRARRWEFNA